MDKTALIGLAFREKCRAKNAAYFQVHRAEGLNRTRLWGVLHPERKTASAAACQHRLKLEALNAYGGPICACCGETLFEGLSIDHINGGGAAERRRVGQNGSDLYRWLKKHGFPPGYQVLCFTCNFAKGTGDHCPHKERTQ